MDSKQVPGEGQQADDQATGGDQFHLSGDFRGATINIKSTLVDSTEAKSIEDLPPEPGDPPYQGLQYFDEDDAGRFFGRELLTARLAARLYKTRFLAVIGASGSGKSSLVRAGLVPALRRGDRMVDGSLPPTAQERWDIRIFTPAAHPLEALANILLQDGQTIDAISALQEELMQEADTLRLAAAQLLAENASKHLLLVIDQFEEVFTLCQHPEEREAFFANLQAAGHPQARQPITILITLRADFYAHFAGHDRLRELISQNQVFIGAMTRQELFDAIVKPASVGGWKIQEGLVELILEEVGDEPGALPLLSHALLETWKRRRGRTLTLSAYAESGGVRGAIAQTAETVFQQRLTKEQQPIARMIFVRLADLGEESLDTRRRATFSELITHATNELVIQTVINILADARLVITDTLPPEGTKVVEVAHEALIREWPTLREWLDENREDLVLHRQLTADTNDWIKLNRDEGALYRGARLKQVLDWKAGYGGMLNLLEQEFLEASQEQQRKQDRAAALQRLYAGISAGLGLAFLLFILYYNGIFPPRPPARMDAIYNIAVAEIGSSMPGGGSARLSDNAGRTLSQWVARLLQAELGEDPSFLVWTDGPELQRQRVSIGPVTGGEVEAKTAAAERMAGRLNADMLVFGNIDTTGDPAVLTLEFWLVPLYEYAFEDIHGNYQLGQPIPVLDPRNPGLEIEPELKRQAGALAWIAIGLTRVQLGQAEQALQEFQRAEQLFPDSDLVHFFVGREFLFLGDRDASRYEQYELSAEEAFKRAIQANDRNYRAYTGLGSVYFRRAQRLLEEVDPQERDGSEIELVSQALDQAEQAIVFYEKVQGSGVDMLGIPIEAVARMGIGKTYRLMGEAYLKIGSDDQARQYFDRAILTLEELIPVFEASGQDRYLAQTYEGLGNAYLQRAHLFDLHFEVEQSKASYQKALAYYDQCIAQGEGSPDLIIKNDIVARRCIPFKQYVQEQIEAFGGGEG